jgi:predicted MFS family arabinose efflux permease
LTFETAAISIVLIGFAAGVEYDLMAFLVARYFGLKSYGAIYGTLYGFFALGAGIGPVVFGRAFDATGSYDGPLMQAVLMLIGGAALLLTLGRYRQFTAPA